MSQPKLKKYQKPRRGSLRWQPLLLALGGLALILAAWFASQQERGAPSLQVDQQEINLGDVKVDQVVQASFTLTNVGDAPLRFTKAPYIEVVEGC